MRHLCLAITLMFTIYISNAADQAPGDTILIYLDNQVELKVALPDYAEYSNEHEAAEVLTKFLDHITGIKDQLDPEKPEIVEFIPGEKIVVKPGENAFVFLESEQGLSSTGYRDVAILKGEKVHITITTSDLSTIGEINFTDCINQLSGELPEKSRHSKTLGYEYKNEALSYSEALSQTNQPLDFLEFSIGAGGGLVRGQWVADLTGEISIELNKKGRMRYNPYLSTNSLFSFNTEGKLEVNSFLNAGFRWNMEKTDPKPDWLGVEVGYLYRNRGDLFGDNTFRLGLNWSLVKGRSVYVSPQLYFTDNFNTVFPGIRVGFGL